MKRSLLLSAGLAALVLVPLGAGCGSSSSNGTSDAGPDATGSSSNSSGGGSGSTSSSGTTSSSGSTSSSGTSSSGSSSSSSSSGSSSGDAGSDATASDGGCSGATPIELKVYNYKAWCNVSVAGTAIPTPGLGTTEAQSVCVHAGDRLSATAVSGTFEIGTPPLPFISGTNAVTDMGATASANLSNGATCVFICCPFAGGSGCSGLTNPCP